MGSISALKLYEVFANVERVLAIELFTAAQALDYRAPLRPGRGVEGAHAALRAVVPHRERDGENEWDLRLCTEAVREGGLLAAVEEELGALG
jgi:histidine ammonia-lyase